MTTSINTIMKNRKNKKGFSLIELIVVLVIMAILAAALVPTLVGYISQTRQSTAKNECAAVVSAAQMIVSSAYADPNGVYVKQSDGTQIDLDDATNPADISDEAAILAEVKNTMTSCDVEYNIATGSVTKVTYVDSRKTKVVYNGASTNDAGKFVPASYEIVKD